MPSTNYGKNIPIDRSGNTLQGYPAAASAIGITVREAGATVSSVTNLNVNTTVVEVTAVGSTGFIKWTPATITASVVNGVSGANFDHAIPSNTFRRFVVPRLTQGKDQVSSIASGLNVSEGLFSAVATMTAGVGSVLLTEY